jgi:hypothetical protein
MKQPTALKLGIRLEVSSPTIYAWFDGNFDPEHVAQRLHELTEEAIGRRDFYIRRVETMEKLLQEIQTELEAQS